MGNGPFYSSRVVFPHFLIRVLYVDLLFEADGRRLVFLILIILYRKSPGFVENYPGGSGKMRQRQECPLLPIVDDPTSKPGGAST